MYATAPQGVSAVLVCPRGTRSGTGRRVRQAGAASPVIVGDES